MSRLRTLTLLLLVSGARAHSGEETSGLIAGLTHPVSGADHLLAMVAVGVLAAPFGGRGLWVPAAFLTAMFLGGLGGLAGVPLPPVEQGIALSVAVLGLLLAFARPLPLPMLAGLAGVMGLLHGHAHGAELPDSASALEFFAGFAVTTALLHAAGFGLGRLGVRGGEGLRLRRSVGAGVAVAGAWLLLG